MKITMDGKYQTREGNTNVRVLCVDADGGQPVVALVDGDVYKFTDDGYFWNSRRNNDADLIPIPEKRTVEFWVNVYEDGVIGHRISPSKTVADDWAKTVISPRIACLHIVREYTVGEGL